jgi:hypothetical protein
VKEIRMRNACIAILLVASAAFAQCDTAKITTTGMVSLETRVAWKPYGKCVVQAYQQANLVGEAGKQSGVPPDTVRIADLTHGNTGRTELKIWAVGGAAPSDAVWVTVEETKH